MKISISKDISKEDLVLNSGDLIYVNGEEFFFQVIKLEDYSYLLYNLASHKYMELLKNNKEKRSLTFKDAINKLNSMFGGQTPTWSLKRREDYNITLNF